MLRLLTILVFFVLPLTASAQTTTYRIDYANSDLDFIYFFGDTPIRGNFPDFQADVRINFDSVSKSAISVTIDPRSATAGIAPATSAMRGPEILDVARFPVISFVSNDVVLGEPPTVDVSGVLTVREIAKPLTVSVRLLADDPAQIELKERLIVGLKGTFSRSDYGASGFSSMVRDEMQLDAKIAIVRAP